MRSIFHSHATPFSPHPTTASPLDSTVVPTSNNSQSISTTGIYPSAHASTGVYPAHPSTGVYPAHTSMSHTSISHEALSYPPPSNPTSNPISNPTSNPIVAYESGGCPSSLEAMVGFDVHSFTEFRGK